MQKHSLGFTVGSLIEHGDGTVSFRRPGHFIDDFRVRIADVTGFSESKGGRKAMEHTIHVFGRGGELLSASVNAGNTQKIEAWFRAHPDFGGNTEAPAPVPVAAAPPTGVADELVKLAALRDQGVLTPAEFDAQKRRLLG